MLRINKNEIGSFDYKSEKFMTAYKFLQRDDLEQMEDGTVELEHGVVAIVQRYITSPAEERNFEAHDRNFDIQYVVRGREYFGIADRSRLEAETEYDPENDFLLFREPEVSSLLELNEGDLVIVSPEEAHKPRCSVSKNGDSVIKVVVKVPV